MARIGFNGPAYTLQTPNVDAQESINLVWEADESGQGKSASAMYSRPGLKHLWYLQPSGDQILGLVACQPPPASGVYSARERGFVISTTSFQELTAQVINGQIGISAVTWRGTINTSGFGNVAPNASIAVGQSHLLFAVLGNCYAFNFSTNVFQQVYPGGVTAAVSNVAYIDGYYIALLADSNAIQISNPLDATTWPGAQIVIPNYISDTVVNMIADHRELWLFGSRQSVAYQDTGSLNIFDPEAGAAFMELGTAGLGAAARADNSVLWWSRSEYGKLIAYRLNGYQPVRISTYAVEWAIQNYPTPTNAVLDGTGYSDVQTFTLQAFGHTYWVSYFAAANVTWVYDVGMQSWHKWGTWNNNTMAFDAFNASCHCYFMGMHLLGSVQQSGQYWEIFQFDPNTYTDGLTAPLRWLRRAPHVAVENQPIRHDELQIDVEAGLGTSALTSGAAAQGAAFIAVQGTNGHVYHVGISDLGVPTVADMGAGSTPAVLINDAQQAATTWQFTVVGGALGITAASYSSNPTVVQVITPGLLQSGFIVALGVLETQYPYGVVRDPQALLRWSDDNCHTWANGRTLNCGKQGQYKKRAIERRLGWAWSRVYELSGSDPVPFRFAEAYLDATTADGQAFAPTKRLTKRLSEGA